MLEVIDRVKKLACSGGRGTCLHAGTGGCVNSGVFRTCDFQPICVLVLEIME